MIEAIEQIRDTAVLPPFDVVPPLPSAIAAGLSAVTGASAVASSLLVVLMAITITSAAVWSFSRPLGRPVASTAALVSALAASRWIGLDEYDRLLFWALLMAALALRSRPWLALAVLSAALLSRTHTFDFVDALALAECFAFAMMLLTPRPILAICSVAGLAFFCSPYLLMADRAVRIPDLQTETNPTIRQAQELVFSLQHAEESLLWLRARAADLAWGPCSKYDLEIEVERWGDCGFDLPGNAAAAALVSRHGLERLKPIRSLLDVEGLERYIRWAERPESISVEREGASLSLKANLGPDDVILLRENWSSNWTVTPDSAALTRDPLGFIVIDPEAPGDFQATLTQARFPPIIRSRTDESRLTMARFPAITPGSAVDALTFERGPFRPGQYISIFGRNFKPDSTHLQLGDVDLKPMWVGESQINFQIPEGMTGALELRAITTRRESYPEPIEVRP